MPAEYPSKVINNTTYYYIGCKKCKNSDWSLLTNEQGDFLACCISCGNSVFLLPVNLKDKPDEHFDMRFFT